MSGVLAAAADTSVQLGTGESVVFWILGPVALAGALGMVFSRNAVHSALWLVLTMLCLGVFYVVQDAPFLGAVQVIVYTGAIMILFLFVLMLVGRDSSDSVVETLRGQRVAATRCPRSVSTTESDESRPTSMRTNRNRIMIAPV